MSEVLVPLGIVVFIIILWYVMFIFSVGASDGNMSYRSWVPRNRISQMLYEWSFQQGRKATQRGLKKQIADRERLHEYERKLMRDKRRG